MFIRSVLCCSALFFSAVLSAAVPDTAGWLQPRGRGWHLTLESAQEAAAQSGKQIYVLFTGSDWCGFCIKLQKDVLKTSRFRSYARKNLELVYVDFPKKKKMPDAQRQYNSTLRSRLGGGGGVPSALILDSKGSVQGKITGYRPLPQYMTALRNPDPAPPARSLPRAKSPARSAVPAAPASAAPAVPEGWGTSLEKALAAAGKSGKKVLVLHTGSDWCPPCKRLGREALSSDGFKTFAAQNLELVFLDSPRRKPISSEQRAYNRKTVQALQMGGGVPSIAILDAGGKVTARTRGYRNLRSFMDFLQKEAGRDR
ncbi:MAG: thioredoxin family protein [Lentisphaeria bacterium]|nr:thioredoxin family protein [Lentisphaeria bacterium]